MSEALVACCTELCLQFIARCALAYTLYLLDVTVIRPHGDRIVRWGRGAQRILHVPECLCPFADFDPGMTDGTMRIITLNSIIIVLAIIAGTLGARQPRMRDPLFVGFGVAYPTIASLVGYIVALVSKRRLVKGQPRRQGPATVPRDLRKGELGVVSEKPVTTPLLVDRELQEDIRTIFAIV